MKHQKRNIYILFLITLSTFLQCNNIERQGVTVGEVTIDQQEGIAKIPVSAAASQKIQLRYQGEFGQVLEEAKTDEKGEYLFEIDLLRGYEQHFVVAVSGADSLSSVEVPAVEAKQESLGLSNEQIEQLLTAHRWKSVADDSRVLVRQTEEKPHYHKLSTFAQKHFTFHPNGIFDLEVSNPKQFAYPDGSWFLDDQGRLSIQTTIPKGSLEFNESHIQNISADRFELLVYVQDGVFLISFIKE